MKKVSISLKPETIQEIEELAKRWNEKSISAMIRYMVEVYVENKLIKPIKREKNAKTTK